MELSDIEKLMEQRQPEVKKEKSQIAYALVLIIAVLITCISLWKNHFAYAVCLGIGVSIGITLRYSRFCFAAAFRNLFITNNTQVLRGVIVALVISSLGFAMIQYGYDPNLGSGYNDIPGTISPVGIHTIIGAFVFGVGMVLAGGCASGTFIRLGEGHGTHLLVLAGFIIGTLLGTKDYSFWHNAFIKNAKTIYFPDYIDLKIVVFVQTIVLILLYRLTLRYETGQAKKRQWRDKDGSKRIRLFK